MKRAKKPVSCQFDIPLNVFRLGVGCFFGPEMKGKMESWAKKASGSPYTIGDTDAGHTNGTVMWVKDASSDRDIIHELHHVVYEICSKTGIRDEEFSAYMQDYLFSRVKAALERRGKP